jgi:hypothetical protein
MPTLASVTAFTTKIEAVIIETNMTVSAEEYFDYGNNRAALFMLVSSEVFKLIYDYNTNELFYVNRKCPFSGFLVMCAHIIHDFPSFCKHTVTCP